MSDSVLDKVTQVICDDPRSGQSLLLFALFSTLNVEKTGHMYMLAKLKEMTDENRQLAYGLIELMASNKAGNEAWQQAFDKMIWIESKIGSQLIWNESKNRQELISFQNNSALAVRIFVLAVDIDCFKRRIY